MDDAGHLAAHLISDAIAAGLIGLLTTVPVLAGFLIAVVLSFAGTLTVGYDDKMLLQAE